MSWSTVLCSRVEVGGKWKIERELRISTPSASIASSYRLKSFWAKFGFVRSAQTGHCIDHSQIAHLLRSSKTSIDRRSAGMFFVSPNEQLSPAEHVATQRASLRSAREKSEEACPKFDNFKKFAKSPLNFRLDYLASLEYYTRSRLLTLRCQRDYTRLPSILAESRVPQQSTYSN